MRLKIELALKNRRLSLNYKSLLQGAIYYALRQDPDLEKLHDHGYPNIEGRPFKLFVFSDLIGSSTIDVSTKTMTFSSNAYFEVAAYDDDVIVAISRYLQVHPSLTLASQLVALIDFEIIPDRLARLGDTLIFKTISPVTVYRSDGNKTIYLKPTNPEFIDSVHGNILKKLASKNIIIDTPASIEIIDYRQRSGHFREIFFETYDLTFSIKKANLEYVRMILNSGIGAKNSMGFGMVRLAD